MLAKYLKTAGFFPAVLGLLILTGCAVPRENHADRSKKYFTLYNDSAKKAVLKIPSENVEEIYYRYVQSYDHGLIEEFFVLRNGLIVPVKMTYNTDSYDFHGTRYQKSACEKKDQRNIVTIKDHKGYSEIKYRIGHTIEQEMNITMKNSQKSFSFTEMGKPGNLLVLKVGR